MWSGKVWFSGSREFEFDDYTIEVDFNATGTGYYEHATREDPGCDEIEVAPEDVEIENAAAWDLEGNDLDIEQVVKKDTWDYIYDTIARECEDCEYEPQYD